MVLVGLSIFHGSLEQLCQLLLESIVVDVGFNFSGEAHKWEDRGETRDFSGLLFLLLLLLPAVSDSFHFGASALLEVASQHQHQQEQPNKCALVNSRAATDQQPIDDVAIILSGASQADRLQRLQPRPTGDCWNSVETPKVSSAIAN